MSATVLYMSMSLDGFIAGPNAGPGNGLGDGGERLHEWVLTGAEGEGVPALVSGGVNGQIVEEFMATGAVVAGRGTFEPAGGWKGDHHDGVPIFILSRHEPLAPFAQMSRVAYVDDVETAMARAKDAAGDRDVLVHGAGVAQLALAAGVLDEMELHLVPVLLGQGRRLFEHLPPGNWSSSAPGRLRARTASRTCTTAFGGGHEPGGRHRVDVPGRVRRPARRGRSRAAFALPGAENVIPLTKRRERRGASRA